MEKLDPVTEIQSLLKEGYDSAKILETVGPLQPYDVSEIVRQLDHDDQLQLMRILPTEVGAEALEYLEPEIQYRILHHLHPDIAVPLLKEMSSDTVVDLLLSIHPNQAAALKQWLPTAYRERIDTLMTFPENRPAVWRRWTTSPCAKGGRCGAPSSTSARSLERRKSSRTRTSSTPKAASSTSSPSES